MYRNVSKAIYAVHYTFQCQLLNHGGLTVCVGIEIWKLENILRINKHSCCSNREGVKKVEIFQLWVFFTGLFKSNSEKKVILPFTVIKYKK